MATNGDAAPPAAAAETAAATAAAAQLDGLRPPEGVIIPPPGEIREVIEKTAGYVARGGLGIEQRLRENHSGNPKFSFVTSQSDAYNPYYEWRKAEYKAGRGTALAAGRADAAALAAAKQAEENKEPQGPPKPPDFEFSARMPRMNQKDLEILRVTALFVARNGRQFQTQLMQRETKNPQFQFLIPNHTFHNFFQHMVDQYAIILKESGMGGDGSKAQEQRIEQLRRNVEDRFHILERAKQRAEYAAWQEQERQKQEAAEEKKKDDFARIDWNDFVVVETIDFTEADANIALPPPTTLNDIQYASLEEKQNFSVNAKRIEEAFPFDDTSYNAYPVQQQQSQPAQEKDSPAGASPAQPAHMQQDPEETRRIQEREQARARMHQAQADARGGTAPMKIKENYVPKAAARGPRTGGQTALCPRCNQQILLSEWEEHMRIELLDPRWKEQKAKAESRYATTNISTADVANNLKRLASQRTDVFDSVTGQPLSEEEMARRKKAAINSYDGNPDGKSQAHIAHLQHVNVEEQIRAIQQKFGDKKE
ncbi:hypothetical protein MCOR25_009785 [Pyricularia grisea]|uniref:SURP motif domain-containing protein n=1 Tax=Pyricularia grisea TaxID=148305 RepID=A0A6P8AY35_PYRGI|nr:hypothetical protein PgNI_10424 [Pyricularia grisea]KAI6351706.1 hypothetical protein MCOR25_009785 [Pyricularia grisea]TLD07268.1 hypothetical protein PgNI_10424 [Pyricularia grisea]